ncbi:hypothetical protein B1H18_29390 [Streptomyces tsukubensis]|uniref:Uncharacterized protein n=1 Tax=Streptomyces tsukubensis TaxID=83656 RepID=A0A1V4A1M6_9ACTN|nr:hypothetical protein B1H18_29390 [Streptomyces tsukubensis]
MGREICGAVAEVSPVVAGALRAAFFGSDFDGVTVVCALSPHHPQADHEGRLPNLGLSYLWRTEAT